MSKHRKEDHQTGTSTVEELPTASEVSAILAETQTVEAAAIEVPLVDEATAPRWARMRRDLTASLIGRLPVASERLRLSGERRIPRRLLVMLAVAVLIGGAASCAIIPRLLTPSGPPDQVTSVDEAARSLMSAAAAETAEGMTNSETTENYSPQEIGRALVDNAAVIKAIAETSDQDPHQALDELIIAILADPVTNLERNQDPSVSAPVVIDIAALSQALQTSSAEIVTATPTETPAPTAVMAATYIVQPGDTLFGIALRYGTDVETLHALNAATITNPDQIQIGQVVQLPASA